MHPYELCSLLKERREDSIVKISPGSLYRTIERLVEDGLAEPLGTEREGKRPERTTYAITQAGRKALQDGISTMLGAPVNEYPRFPVALSEAHNLPLEQVLRHLTERAEQLAAQVEEKDRVLRKVRARGVPEAYWFVVDYLRTVQFAELDWIRTLITRLENKEIPWPLETTNP